MKRLVSVLVAVFFMTGMVVAQNNTATTTQNGNGNNAEVEQLGADHESYIIQDSKTNKHNTAAFGNEASVKQYNGDENYSLIHQNEGSGSKDGDADVEQKGSENESEIYQGYGYYNDMDLYQEGNENWSSMTQNGSGNDAEVDQIGNGNQSDAFQRGGAILDVYQEGDGNDADSHQDYSGQEADIDQVGNDNMVDVTQMSRPEPVVGNYAEVNQEGDNNETIINQDGDNNEAKHWVKGHDNDMEITQEGRMNVAVVDQKTWKDADNNYGNDITVEQTNNSNGDGNDFYAKLKGDNNIINISQNGSYNGIRGLNGNVYGYGGMATAFMYEGDNSEIDITQEHNANRVFAEIRNSKGDIDVEQYSRNTAVIDVKGYNDGLLSGNVVDISQNNPNRLGNAFSSKKNWVGVTQRSDNNIATVSQNGWNNNATIFQD